MQFDPFFKSMAAATAVFTRILTGLLSDLDFMHWSEDNKMSASDKEMERSDSHPIAMELWDLINDRIHQLKT
jgi:hypothetical protein